MMRLSRRGSRLALLLLLAVGVLTVGALYMHAIPWPTTVRRDLRVFRANFFNLTFVAPQSPPVRQGLPMARRNRAGAAASTLVCDVGWQGVDPLRRAVCQACGLGDSATSAAALDNERPNYPAGAPRVVVLDESQNMDYYVSRDLRAWRLAYEGVGCVVEQGRARAQAADGFTLLLCLGMATIDDRCLARSELPLLAPAQRYSQMHGLRNILWRKDAFCFTVQRFYQAAGRALAAPAFLFPCYMLPDQDAELRAAMAAGAASQQLWIVKPRTRGEGRGIFLAREFSDIARTVARAEQAEHGDGRIVQPFLHTPLLAAGRKFDLRCYVLLTSLAPLRAYLYDEGLARFAATPYDRHAADGGAMSQWLTNTFVNKQVSSGVCLCLFVAIVVFVLKINIVGVEYSLCHCAI